VQIGNPPRRAHRRSESKDLAVRQWRPGVRLRARQPTRGPRRFKSPISKLSDPAQQGRAVRQLMPVAAYATPSLPLVIAPARLISRTVRSTLA
jgi:hypothetical protein